MSQKLTTQVGAGTTKLTPTMNIIEVDTSGGAVELIMPSTTEIQRVFGGSPVKFVIQDVTGNAATNNITIKPNPNTSETVNNLTEVVLSISNIAATIIPIYGLGYAINPNMVSGGGGGGGSVRTVSKTITAAEMISLVEGDSNAVDVPFTDVTLARGEYISATQNEIITTFVASGSTITQADNVIKLVFNEDIIFPNITKIQNQVGVFVAAASNENIKQEMPSSSIRVQLGAFPAIPINTLTQGEMKLTFVIEKFN